MFQFATFSNNVLDAWRLFENVIADTRDEKYVCEYEVRWRLMMYRISVEVSFCHYTSSAKEERHIFRPIHSFLCYISWVRLYYYMYLR